MNKSDFFALGMADQIRSVKAALDILPPILVFGSQTPKERYRKLSQMYHPDLWRTNPVIYPLAEDLQSAINAEWEEYNMGTNGAGGTLLGKGDLADVYLEGRNISKISRGDNDLLEREATVLRKLNAHPDYETFSKFYVPRLVDSGYNDDDRVMNRLTYCDDVSPEQLFSLAQLARGYDFEIPIHAAGWIWRRILAALSLGHYFGVIHGAVTPDHVLLKPGIAGTQQHRGFLIDWCFSVDEDNGEIIPAMCAQWEMMYPQEVRAKQTPVPATDIYMAARTMLWAFPLMPDEMARYFKRCVIESPHGRGWKIVELLSQWDDVMYNRLGWQKAFVPLNFAAVDWSWWDA